MFGLQDGIEEMLFDYSVQAGDTLPDCSINNACSYPMVVSSVDSVLVEL